MKPYSNFKVALTISVIFLCVSMCYSQEEIILSEIQQQEILQQYNIISLEQDDWSNRAFISQLGDANKAQITQVNHLHSLSNVTVITQLGNFNQGYTIQNGMGNLIELYQTGNFNNAYSSAEGDLLKLLTLQFGDENKVLQEVSGSGAEYNAIQIGNNNAIEQRGDGSSSGYTITQYGNNMNITVEQTSYLK